MKKSLLFLFFILSLNLFAQKEANFWYFGDNAGLDFSTNPPTALTNGALSTDEGSASISDSNGNLLFYTDGSLVFNKNNVLMVNGSGLLGNSSSAQSAIIVPKPLDENIYYIFTVGQNGGTEGVNFSIVDISLNGGLGEVITKNQNLPEVSAAREKITSVAGTDCNTFWVITSDTNRFYAYKIDSFGIDTIPVQSPHDFISENGLRGYLKLSPDGKKLVSASQSNSTFLYDFDASNGSIVNERGLNVPGSGYGVEFSRDSKKLYISTGSTLQGGNSPSPTTISQFSLDQNNDDRIDNIVDINNNRTIINSSTGYRGALQLASNGKIYYARGNQSFLGIINSPEEEAANVDYVEDGVNLGSGLAKEGLPPFIQSFFLPIDITDLDTGQVINDQNLQFCVGDDKTLETAMVTGNNIVYSWTFEDGTNPPTDITPAINPNILELINLQKSNSGKYTLKITLTDDCGNPTELNGVFSIEVFDAAVATKPEDIFLCDADNDGFNSFDLQSERSGDILDTLDPAIFEVIYYDDLTNANNDVNPLPNPFTNPSAFSSQTIYARVQNRNAPDACFDITDFTLAVTGLPVPQTPTEYRICDNTTVGSDTDGFINDFILSTKDAEILGSLNATQYNVSYHTTLNGAQTSATLDVIDKTTNYTNTTANSQPIFVRVENVDNTNCFDASETFNLVVSPLPVIDNTVELRQCDTDIDGFIEFNLNEAASDISTDFMNETFVFFETQADAESGSDANAISNPTTYRNQIPFSDTVYAKAVTTFGCFRVSELTLTISATDIPPTFNRTFNECDDFLQTDGTDGSLNDDTDGITSFDFSSVTADILSGFANPNDLTVTYYRTEADALAEQNVIADPSNYRNIGFANNQDIYVRVDSNSNNDCVGLGNHVTLIVDPVPTANPVSNLELCDDNNDGSSINGIVQSFDLESQNATILGTQSMANFTVTYHASATDANNGLNSLASPYTNTTPNLQTIFVRVQNNNTNCFTDHTTFDLIVNPLPVANFVADLEICDDNSDGSARNGFSQSIDLESQSATILGTQDPADFDVTYHISLAEAQAGTNPLSSPYSNSTPNRETIFVRVFDQSTQCANGISNFDVIVNPEPIFVQPTNLANCDDDTDGDDTNGIIQTIDLDSKIVEILGNTQDPNDYNVTFHNLQADATSGANPIDSPYTNSTPTETIFVRIQNIRTLCVNDDATFDVIVNPLPDFTVTTPQIVCLNILPLNIAVENPQDIYTYEWTNPNGDIISNIENVDVSTGGLYSVTATKTDGTGCSKTKTIQVDESIIATLTLDDITVIDDSNNNSISINNTNGNLGIGDYEYALEDADGNTIRNYQDESIFENLDGEIYTVLVRDKNGCGVANIQIPVVEFPKFFTPNGDGTNDTWTIKGANITFFPNSEINVFDRYGKLVGKIPLDSPGWNGTYNGKLLPSDDYWYSIKLVDTNGNLRERVGNFSLLRK